MIQPRAWLVLLWLSAFASAGAGCDCSASDVRGDAAMDSAAQDTGTDDRDSSAATDSAVADASAFTDAARDARIDNSDPGFQRGCMSVQCDLIDNGCDNGQACYYLPSQLNGVPQPRCAAAGDNAASTICTNQEQCAPGLGCDPGNRCRNYCCAPGETAGCPDGQACLVEFRDGNDQSLLVGLCQDCDNCDPVSSEGCDNGEACYPVSNDGACRLCITPRDNGNVGASCTTNSDCRAGLGCLATTPPTCARFCSVTTGTGCSGDATCVAIGYTGLPNLGFCEAP